MLSSVRLVDLKFWNLFCERCTRWCRRCKLIWQFWNVLKTYLMTWNCLLRLVDIFNGFTVYPTNSRFFFPKGFGGISEPSTKIKKTECVHAIPRPLLSLQSPSRAFFRHPRPAQVALLMTKLSAVNMCTSQKTYRSLHKFYLFPTRAWGVFLGIRPGIPFFHSKTYQKKSAKKHHHHCGLVSMPPANRWLFSPAKHLTIPHRTLKLHPLPEQTSIASRRRAQATGEVYPPWN